MSKYKWLNFRLFEDGGEGFGLGDAARAFGESIGMDLSEFQNAGNLQPQGNGDTQAEFGNQQQSEESFDDLIAKGGKYHDEFGQKMQSAINERFKNQQNLQGQVDTINEAIAPLYQKYGLSLGDVAGLTKSIANDEDLYASAAEREGLSTEQYMENLRLRSDAERGRQIMDEYKAQQERNAKFANWEAQADELKAVFPNMDLGMELQNPQFGKMLDSGISVADAFYATHMRDILSGMNQETEKATQQQVMSNLQARASRPTENGAKHSAAVTKQFDPSSISDADMDSIIRNALNGQSFNPY